MKIFTIDSQNIGRVYHNVLSVVDNIIILHTRKKDFDQAKLAPDEKIVNVTQGH